MSMCVNMPNFMPIGKTIAEIWPFSDVSRWQLSAILICLTRVWTTHKEYLVFFVTEKFGWNQWSSFDNMQVLIFCALGLKCLFTPTNRVWRQYERDPRRQWNFRARKHVVWHIGLQNRSQVTCHVFAQTTHVVTAHMDLLVLSYPRRSYMFKVSLKSIQRFLSPRWSKLGLSQYFSH